MASAIENVVFDMGNVLMTFDGRSFSRSFTDTEDDAALLHAALFGRTEWALLDAGAISHDTMRRVAENHLPERLIPNLHACLEGWPHQSRPIDGVCDLVPRLKDAGYGLYLLSNASTSIDRQLAHCPAYPLMDGRVVSGFERMMKPDPAIYLLLCSRYGLAPASCLFIDDNEDNCRGAEAAGMQAFHFTGDAAPLERMLLEA
ncbi:HAD family hydrolase [Collinsella ihumii]|uniref:HAD family hydrolase n=1 Tax=Collinsella ihumii TaxID=1720204 RepID=UPI00082D8522|nr:HAD family phosphatase [Collinsella ihumii]